MLVGRSRLRPRSLTRAGVRLRCSRARIWSGCPRNLSLPADCFEQSWRVEWPGRQLAGAEVVAAWAAAPTPKPCGSGCLALVAEVRREGTLDVATESRLGADSLMGRPWPRRPTRVRQFWSGPRRRRFPEALLGLCRGDRAGSTGRWSAPPRSGRGGGGGLARYRGPSSQAPLLFHKDLGPDSGRARPADRFLPGCGHSRRRPWLECFRRPLQSVLMTLAAASWVQPAMAIFPGPGAAQAP